MSIALTQGRFQAPGNSDEVYLCRKFNVSISGTFAADLALERSFDSGATWVDVGHFDRPFEGIGEEPEAYVLYRLRCINLTSGEVHYRLSQ